MKNPKLIEIETVLNIKLAQQRIKEFQNGGYYAEFCKLTNKDGKTEYHILRSRIKPRLPKTVEVKDKDGNIILTY